jgi:hypothetical protein
LTTAVVSPLHPCYDDVLSDRGYGLLYDGALHGGRLNR